MSRSERTLSAAAWRLITSIARWLAKLALMVGGEFPCVAADSTGEPEPFEHLQPLHLLFRAYSSARVVWNEAAVVDHAIDVHAPLQRAIDFGPTLLVDGLAA